MINKLLVIIFVCTLFFSCEGTKNIDNNTVETNTEDFNAEETQIKDEIVLRQKKRLDNLKHSIAGYYNYGGYILFIDIEDNKLVIQKVNVINNEYSNDEIIRFDLDLYDVAAGCFFNGDNKLKVSFNYADRLYSLSLSITDHESYFHFPAYSDAAGAMLYNGDYLSKTMDKVVMKYTYDYQKSFIGKYVYDSYLLFGIEEDDFNNKYNNEQERREINIDIDDNGFLFINDGYGKSYYKNWETKIIDENGQTTFFGNAPAYGHSVHLYFFESGIIFEKDLDWNDMKYQLVFKHKKVNGA
jgi:hypothetical protein